MSQRRIISELREMWQPLDPALHVGQPDTAVREADLRRIIGVPLDGALPGVNPPPRVGRLRRSIFAAAGAVAAGGVLVVANPLQGPSFAATPPPLTSENQAGSPAGALLREYVSRTNTLPATASRYGEHLSVESWSLDSRIAGDRVDSAVIPVEREQWRDADGSGRVEISYGRPTARKGGLKGRLSTWWTMRKAEDSDTRYGAGAFPSLYPSTQRPPTDDVALRDYIKAVHNPALGDWSILTGITDLARERVLTGPEQAAVLRLLASLPSLEHIGPAVDRENRHGEAFSLTTDASGLPTKYTIIVDPKCGRLLAAEQMLTKSAGSLPVKVPAVIAYETYEPAS